MLRTLLHHSVQLVSARAALAAAVPLSAPVAAVQPHELLCERHFGIMHEHNLRFVDKLVRWPPTKCVKNLKTS